MHIILAPYIDDEMIGCYALLFSNIIQKVVYFYDLSPELKAEAVELGKFLGIDISFEGFKFTPNKEDTLYIP